MAQSFYPTAQQIIDRALTDIGAIDPEGGVTPSTAQRTDALQILNFIVTAWQAHGMQVWCQKEATYVLSEASSYTVGPGATIDIARPLSIQQAWLRNTDDTPDTDSPLQIVSREEYNMLTSKESTGTPSLLFYDPQYDLPAANDGANTYGKIFIWPVPTADVVTDYDLHFIYTRPIQDFSAVSDSLDFPQEWANAVRWNLAYELCPGYEVPVMKFDRIKIMAENSLLLAMSWDREQTSLYISPACE